MEKSKKDKYLNLLIKSEMWDSASNLEVGEYLDEEAIEFLKKGGVDETKAAISDKKAKEVFDREYEKSPIYGATAANLDGEANTGKFDSKVKTKKKVDKMEKADNVKTTDKSMINIEDPKNKEILDKKEDVEKCDMKKEEDEKPTLAEIVKKKTREKLKQKNAKKPAERLVEREEKGKPWALTKSLDCDKAAYNTLGQWELKKGSDMGQMSFEIDSIYEDVVEEANSNKTIKEGLLKHENAKIEKLIKTAICVEMNKFFSGIRELELKKSEQINKIEKLEKSLFNETKDVVSPSPTEEEKPSREALARELCWKLADLKELIDKKYTVESEYKWGPNADEKTFNKIKNVLETRYRKLKSEIEEIVDKYNKSRLTKNDEELEKSSDIKKDLEVEEEGEQLKLKDIKRSGLSGKDKRALDPDNSPKARMNRAYEGGTPLKTLKTGIRMLKDKISDNKADKEAKIK